jgi:hypothetical protein
VERDGPVERRNHLADPEYLHFLVGSRRHRPLHATCQNCHGGMHRAPSRSLDWDSQLPWLVCAGLRTGFSLPVPKR